VALECLPDGRLLAIDVRAGVTSVVGKTGTAQRQWRSNFPASGELQQELVGESPLLNVYSGDIVDQAPTHQKLSTVVISLY
jgi:hypothetical protein